jgi:hypothetical protein
MDDLASTLRPFVDQIKAAAAKGDRQATQIINLYQMHVRCPGDPGAPALCRAAFDEWNKRKTA